MKSGQFVATGNGFMKRPIGLNMQTSLWFQRMSIHWIWTTEDFSKDIAYWRQPTRLSRWLLYVHGVLQCLGGQSNAPKLWKHVNGLWGGLLVYHQWRIFRSIVYAKLKFVGYSMTPEGRARINTLVQLIVWHLFPRCGGNLDQCVDGLLHRFLGPFATLA